MFETALSVYGMISVIVSVGVAIGMCLSHADTSHKSAAILK
jgi:hypothetical protein